MNVDEPRIIPDEPKELLRLYHQVRGEIKRLEKEIRPVRETMAKILAEVPGLKQKLQAMDEFARNNFPQYSRYSSEGLLALSIMDFKQMNIPPLGRPEQLAINRLDKLAYDIRDKANQFFSKKIDLQSIRVKAASRGIKLPKDGQGMAVVSPIESIYRWLLELASSPTLAEPLEDEVIPEVLEEDPPERNPRGAGRPSDPKVKKRRETMFEFLRKEKVSSKEEVGELIRRMDARYRLYDYLDEKNVKMIESDKYSEINQWSDLKKDGNGVEDLEVGDYLIKDMRRKWNRFWNNKV